MNSLSLSLFHNKKFQLELSLSLSIRLHSKLNDKMIYKFYKVKTFEQKIKFLARKIENSRKKGSFFGDLAKLKCVVSF